jgi:oligopeptide transport system ATP-binding protein
MTRAEDPILVARNLTMHFPVRQGGWLRRKKAVVRAVDGLTFQVERGETFGLVGESGCGKSTTGRTILQLYRATAGEVLFEGVDLCLLKGQQLRQVRRKMQMIFQDPYASLNPRMTVGNIIAEPLRVHGLAFGAQRRERVAELMRIVGLNPLYAERYPHEFSGGQRQRVGVARALAVQPEFIICDEPVSALDVSIQAQIINLLEELQDEFSLTYLFIAHDLSVVRHISDRVAVMYLGRIVELAGWRELYSAPLHPYTRALLSAVPIPDPVEEEQRRRTILTGDIPSAIDSPPGCRFHTRCPEAMAVCRLEEPEYEDNGGGHWVACHLCRPTAPHAQGAER